MDSHKKPPDLTCGFLIDWAYLPYHVHLLKGAKSAAQDLNINQIVYIGGNINSSTHQESNRNILYHFIDPHIINGLIISAGTMARFCTLTDINKFCKQFKPIPIITITHKIKDIPFIGIDNETGFRQLMNHLLHDHHYKRIAFIKGTEGNTDAIERFRLFKIILKENGVPFYPQLVFPGSFIYDSGEEAVSGMLDKRNETCDVIVASNDDMALGAIAALKARGIDVPRDIAVVGFDNQDISLYLSVPLTTVNQPILEIGYKAVELLSRLCMGEKIALENKLPTSFICRNSCGCNQLEDSLFLLSPHTPGQQGDIKKDKKKSILLNIKQDFPCLDDLHFSAIKRLVASLFESAHKNNPEIFLHEVTYLLFHPSLFTQSTVTFTHIYSSLHTYIHTLCIEDEETQSIKYLLLQGQFLFSEKLRKDILYEKSMGERELQVFRFRFDDIVSSFSMKNIAGTFTRILPESGIKRCFLSLYDDESEKIPQISRLIFAYNDGKTMIPKEEDALLFPTKKLFPDNVFSRKKQTTLFVDAVFFGLKQLGMCILEFESYDVDSLGMARKMYVDITIKATLYIQRVNMEVKHFRLKENARIQALSSANELLTGLYKQKEKAEEAVRILNQDLEKRVQERTLQLKQANEQLSGTLKQLKIAQNTLVQTEKLAALGKLVAAIAHEINTPIGIGVTAASHLNKITNQLMKTYSTKLLKRSDMEKYISDSVEASGMVLSNLTRAYKLINSFKRIAVDQSHEEKRVFKVKKYLEEIFLSLKPGFKKRKYKVNIHCPRQLAFNSYPGAFSQVITNFVINSLNHGFNNNTGSVISVSVKQSNNSLIIRYFDDGKGIPKKNLGKIYDPFFTTNKKHGGTGLGLHIVYNLVTQTFHGTIKCMSRKNNGTLFKLMFPLNIQYRTRNVEL